MDASQFQTLLGRTPLLAGVAADARDGLLQAFLPHPFAAGEPIVRAGSEGRYLGVLVEGRALVQARREDHAWTVEVLEAGAVFGEISFFDAQQARTADVVGDTAGVAALLPYADYQHLVRVESPAAEVLEKRVLDLLAARIKVTDGKLAELLVANRQGTFRSALRRMFGGRRA
jgi:CRP-like cAMP-binding protein